MKQNPELVKYEREHMATSNYISIGIVLKDVVKPEEIIPCIENLAEERIAPVPIRRYTTIN